MSELNYKRMWFECKQKMNREMNAHKNSFKRKFEELGKKKERDKFDAMEIAEHKLKWDAFKIVVRLMNRYEKLDDFKEDEK